MEFVFPLLLGIEIQHSYCINFLFPIYIYFPTFLGDNDSDKFLMLSVLHLSVSNSHIKFLFLICRISVFTFYFHAFPQGAVIAPSLITFYIFPIYAIFSYITCVCHYSFFIIIMSISLEVFCKWFTIGYVKQWRQHSAFFNSCLQLK